MDDDLAAALDRLAIEEVINRYFFAVDVRDIDMVVSCFTPNAVVRLMDGRSVMHGRDELRDAFSARRGTAMLGLTEVVGSSHVVGNIRTELHRDTARATTLSVAFLKGKVDGSEVLMQRGISYVDDLVRADGRWLIAARLHSTRWHHMSPSGSI